MSQHAEISFKEFQRRFQIGRAVRRFCLSGVGRKDWFAQSVEDMVAIGFAASESMSASSAAAKARSRRELSCTVPIFR